MSTDNEREPEQWRDVATNLPPEHVVVMTCIDDGGDEIRNEQPLQRVGRLFWTAGSDMYVYYMPTHWRYLHTAEQIKIMKQLDQRVRQVQKAADEVRFK